MTEILLPRRKLKTKSANQPRPVIPTSVLVSPGNLMLLSKHKHGIPYIFYANFLFVTVCAIPKNEDEALRKVFEYLKRKYSEDTSDGEDTDTLPTLEPLTPPPTVQQDMRGGAHDIYTLPTLEPLTPPLTAREPQEVKSHDMKQISLPGKTELNGKSVKNEFHKPHTLPGCDFLLNILHEAPSLPIKNDIIGEWKKAYEPRHAKCCLRKFVTK